MPAVDLTVLNSRLQSLQLFRSDARIYLQKLEDLLSMYSSEKTKLGETTPFQTLLRRLYVPDLVLEKIIETFPALTHDFLENAIDLLDTLWDREELEYKILAVNLLLCLPVEKREEISKRLLQWVSSTDEELLHSVVLAQLPFSHKENSTSIQTFIEHLMHMDDPEMRKLAFHILARVIEQKHFSDLPWVFNILAPFIEAASLQTYGQLNPVMTALIRKSEIETIAFLYEICTHANSTKARKYVRKIIHFFTPENQKYLIEVL
ncbi:MAG TPA: DNA alkylation repair protein [Anaerolineaceae bacterium]|jgi:hypothetical protein|nr:DNA alkylation repair protein [Anaerolineaceae bacterium]